MSLWWLCFNWNDVLPSIVTAEAASTVSARNGIAARRNVHDLESDDVATSPFAAGTGYRVERTGADGHGHDGR
jgi:hypothetical protein